MGWDGCWALSLSTKRAQVADPTNMSEVAMRRSVPDTPNHELPPMYNTYEIVRRAKRHQNTLSASRDSPFPTSTLRETSLTGEDDDQDLFPISIASPSSTPSFSSFSSSIYPIVLYHCKIGQDKTGHGGRYAYHIPHTD